MKQSIIPKTPPVAFRSSPASLRPVHPFLRGVALLLVVALTLTGPVTPVAMAATVYSTVGDDGVFSVGTVSAGTLVITPGTLSVDGTLFQDPDGKIKLAATGALLGGSLDVRNLTLDDTYSLSFRAVKPTSGSSVFTLSGSGSLGAGAIQIFPAGYGLQPGMVVSLGTASLNSGTGYLLDVSAGTFTATTTAGGTTKITSSSAATTLSMTAIKAGLWGGKIFDFSDIAAVKLVDGGTLDTGKGLNVSSVGTSGLFLAGSANILVNSSTLFAGFLGSAYSAVRVDSLLQNGRSNLSVTVGSTLGKNEFGETTPLVSEAFLDLGARIDITKNGSGVLMLGTLVGGTLQGGASLFSGTITTTGGSLFIGNGFLGVSPNAQMTAGTRFVYVDAVDLQGIKVGMPVSGTGIPAGSTVTAVDVDGSLLNSAAYPLIQISQNATATGGSYAVSVGSLSSLRMTATGTTTVVGFTGPVSFSELNGTAGTGGTLILGIAQVLSTSAPDYFPTTATNAQNQSYVPLTVAGSGVSDFSGIIKDVIEASEDGILNYGLALVKRGTGTLALRSDSSTYLFGTTLYGGSLWIGASSQYDDGSISGQAGILKGPLGRGALTLLGGTLYNYSPETQVTLHNDLVLYSSSDSGTFSRTITFAGTSGSSFVLAATPYADGGKGVSLFGSPTSISPINSTINLEVNIPVTFTGDLSADTSISASDETSVTLVKKGSSTLTLSGANSVTYDGDIRIESGTIVLGAADALGSTRSVTVTSGGALDLHGFSHQEFSGAPLILSGTGVENSGALTNRSQLTATYWGSGSLAGSASIGGVESEGGIVLFGALSSGSYTLTKVGPNTLFLAGDNMISGAVIVQDGALQIGYTDSAVGDRGTFGSGSISLSSTGILRFSRVADVGSFSNTISGLGAVEKDQSGTLTLSGANTYSGPTTIFAGKLKVGSSGALGNTSGIVLQNAGVLDLNGFSPATTPTLMITGTGASNAGALVNDGSSAATYSGTLNIGSAITFDDPRVYPTVGGGSPLTLSGNIVKSDLGAVVVFQKAGTNAVILSGASNESDATRIISGTLQIGAGASSGSLGSGTVAIDQGATLLINRSGNVTAGSVSGAGAVMVQAGSLILSGTANTFTGGYTVNGGTLFAVSRALDAVGSLFSNGGLLQASSYNASAPMTLGASGRAIVSGTNLTISGSISNANTAADSLQFTATTGTITLSSLSGVGSTRFFNNAIFNNALNSGSIVVGGSALVLGDLSGGVLTVAGSAALSSVSGGTVRLNGAFGLIDALNGGSIVLGGTNATSVNYGNSAGLISGSGALVKSGALTLTLSGNNTYFGSTTVLDGTLIALAGALGNSGTLNVNAGSLIASTFRDNAFLSLSSAGAASFSAVGGTLANVANTGSIQFTGTTGTVTIGSLSGTGRTAFQGGGSIRVVSEGTLNFNGATASIGTLSGGSLVLGSGNALSVASGNSSGSIIGAGSLVKTGAGSLTLSGQNSFSGSTTVEGGTLRTFSGALANTSAILVNQGSLNADDYNAGVNLTVGASGFANISGTGLTLGGTVSNNSSLALGVNFSGISGMITLGSLTGSGKTAFASDATVNGGISSGSVTVGGGSAKVLTANVSGGSVSAGTLMSGIISGGVVSAGSLVSGLVNGGTVTVGAGAASLTTVSGGSLTLNGLASITTLNGGSLILGSSNVTTVSSGASAGLISGSGSLVKSGSLSLTLSGNNTYFGSTTVLDGTLIAGAGALGNSGSLNVNAGSLIASNFRDNALLSLSAAGAASFSATGGTLANVANAGSIQFTGTTGTVTIGSLSGTGRTAFLGGGSIRVVSEGTLNFNGATASIGTLNGGSLALGSGNVLSVGSGNSSGWIIGAGSLLKTGAGSLTLSGQNSFSGSTTVEGGTLRTLSGALSNTSALLVTQGSLNADDYNAGVNLTVGASGFANISGTGLTLGGTVSNNSSLALGVNFSGIAGTITLGSLTGSGKTAFASDATVNGGISGGIVVVGAGGSKVLTANVSGGSVSAGTLTSGIISGGIVSAGSLASGLVTGGTVTVGAGAASLMTVSGGSLTLNGLASITTVNGGSLNLNGTTANIGTLNGGSLVLGSANTVTVGSGSSAGAIVGSGSFTKDVTGVLTLSGTNTFTGWTTVGGGILNTGSGALSNTGAVFVNQGSLNAVNYRSGANLTVGNVGTATISGTGLTLSGTVSNNSSLAIGVNFSGTTGLITLGSLAGLGATVFGSDATVLGGISGGAVTLGASKLLTASISGGSVSTGSLLSTLVSGGSVTVGGTASVDLVSGGTLNFNGATARVGTLNGGSLVLGGANVLSVESGSSSGVILGSGSLVKTGAGSLTLSGVNTYTGATSVNGGTLVTATGALGGSGTLNVNGGVLRGTDFASQVVLNIGSGAASFSVNGGALGGVNNAGLLQFTGTSGTITLASLSGLGTTSFAAGATLLGAGINSGTVSALQGLLTVNTISGGSVNAGTLSSGTLSGGATTVTNNATVGVVSGGSLSVAGTASLSTVSGGTFATTSSGSASIGTVAGGSLSFNGSSANIGTLNGGTIKLANNNALSVQAGSSAAVISGNGSLIKTGLSDTLYLRAINTFSGSTTISQGTLAFIDGGSVAGAIVNNSSLLFNQTSDLTYSGSLYGAGALVKAGLNSLTLTNGGGFTGLTTVSAGSLVIKNNLFGAGGASVVNNATLHLLSIGTSAAATFSGTISGSGLTFLSGTASEPLKLTLGAGGSLGANVKIGQYATLTLASAFSGTLEVAGGVLNFGSNELLSATTLTLSSGTIDLRGTTQTAATLVFKGGSLASSGSVGLLTYDTVTNGTQAVALDVGTSVISVGGSLTISQNTQFEVIGNGTVQGSTLRLTSGVLKHFGSGTLTSSVATAGTTALAGTYQVVEARGNRVGATLTFDQPVVASGSVLATLNGGSTYFLAINAPVTAPFMDIQNGVSATFGSLGSYASSSSAGTLQIEGLVTLSGTSKTFGLVNLFGGTLATASGVTASFGSLNATGGVLSAALAGSSPIGLAGGILTISGDNNLYSGITTLSSGTLRLAHRNALGSVGSLVFSSNSALLQLNGTTITLGTLVGAGVIENGSLATASLKMNPVLDASFSAQMRDGTGGGAFSFEKLGQNKLTIAANQLYTGTTTVSAGSLVLASGTSLAAASALWLNGGTFDLGGNTQTFSSVTLSGGSLQGGTTAATGSYELQSGVVNAVLGGSANLSKTNSGTVTILSTSTYSGSSVVSAGLLVLGNGGLLGTGSLTLSGGALNLGTASQNVASALLSGGSVYGGSLISNNLFDFRSGAADSVLGGAAILTKSGTGTVTLGGSNQFAGGVQLYAGSLVAGVAGALSNGNLTVSGGTLYLGTLTLTLGTVSMSDGLLSGGTLKATGYAFTGGSISTVLDGASVITALTINTGVVTLNAPASFLGGTTITLGTLKLGVANALASAGPLSINGGELALGQTEQHVGPVTLFNGGRITGGTITGTSYAINEGTVTSILAGSAALTKSGPGTTTLQGANTYFGSTTITGGSLVASAGALAATSALVVNGATLMAVNYNPSANLTVDSSGRAVISGGTTATLAVLTNNNTSVASIDFSAQSGTISLAGLSGVGSTTFRSDAFIGGSISNGFVSVARRLTTDINGGSVSTGTLSSQFVGGGTVTAESGSIATLAGGSVKITGASVSVGTLNGGSLALDSSTTLLTVDSGTSSGTISGAGSLLKRTSQTLTLSGANIYSGSTTVSEGTLIAGAGALAQSSSLGIGSGVLSAVDFKNNASLSVSALGIGSFSTSGGALGAVSNAGSLRFTGTSGTITLGSLSGLGSTTFSSSGVIAGGSITGGTVSALSGWLTANISGGAVSADTLVSGTISGGLVTTTGSLTSTGLVSGGTVTVGGTASLATVSGGSLTFNGVTASVGTLNGGALVLGVSNVTTIFSGSSSGLISGAGSLVKLGAGSLTLSGANTFTGSTSVNAGTLVAMSGALNGSGSLFVNGGILRANDFKNQASLSITSGEASFSASSGTLGDVSNAGSLRFTGANGTMTLGSLSGVGITSFSSNGSISNGSITEGTVTALQGLLTANISGGSVSAGSLLTATISGGSVTTTGSLTSTGLVSGGTVTVGGTAKLTLVTGGSLNLNGTSASIGTLNGGALALAAGNILSVGLGDSSGVISGAGSLLKTGSTQLTLSANNTLTGTTTVRAGTLMITGAVGGSYALGDGQTSVSDAPTLLFGNNSTRAIVIGAGNAAYVATLGGTSTAGTTVLSGSISMVGNASLVLLSATGGTLETQGVWNTANKSVTIGAVDQLGTVKLSSQLATSGSVNLAYGTLVAGVANMFSSTTPVNVASTAALNLGTFSTASGKFTLSGGSLLGTTGTLTATSYESTGGYIGGLLGGSGPLTKTGADMLTIASASASYTGTTTVSGGTLAFTGAGIVGGSLVNNGGSLYFSNNADVSLASLVSGIGSLTKVGSNQLTLNGGANYTGATTITGGSLVVVQAASSGAAFSSNSVQNSGTLQLQLAGGSSTIGGTIAGSGALQLSAASASNLTSSGSWTFNTLNIGNNVTLTLDSLARATGSILLDGGTLVATGLSVNPSQITVLSGKIRLTIDTVVNPAIANGVYDIGANYAATFTSAGSLASGTLQVGGSVDLGGNTKSFGNISLLLGGELKNGTLSSGSLNSTGGLLSTSLGSGLGDVTMSGTSGTDTLTVAGSSAAYAGSLRLVSGIVRLGTANALGSGGASVVLGGTGPTPVLQLNGTDVTLASLTNSGTAVIENGASAASSTLTLSNSSAFTYSGTVRNGGSASLALVKNGSGAAVLTGILGYTGGTTVNNGSLVLSGALAGGAVNINGGTFDLGGVQSAVSAVTVAGGLLQNGVLVGTSYALQAGQIAAILSGSADVIKTATTSVTLSGANSLSGLFDVQSGSLLISGNGALSSGSLKLSGASLVDLGGSTQSVGTVTLSSGTIRNGALLGTSYVVQSGSVGAVLTGAGTLTKDTLGTVVLSGSNSLSGVVDIQAGTLSLVGAGSLSSGSLRVSGSSILELGGGMQRVGAVSLSNGEIRGGTLIGTSYSLQEGRIAAVLSGTGNVVKIATTSVTLSGANSLSGLFDVQSGSLLISGNGALSSGSLKLSGASLVDLGGTTQNVGTLTLTSGTIRNGALLGTSYLVQSGSVGVVLTGDGTLTKNTSGTVVLSGSNVLTGRVDLQAGTLALAGAGSLSSGSLQLGGSSVLDLGGLTQTVGTVMLTSGAINNGSLRGSSYLLNSGSISAVLLGAGSIYQSTGTTVLHSANLFTGEATIFSGTFVFANGQALASASKLTIAPGGSLQFANGVTAAALRSLVGDLTLTNASNTGVALTLNTNGDLVYGGSLSGKGSLVKAGTGTLTLTNVPQAAVGLTVAGGSVVAGNLFDGARSITLAGGSLVSTLTSGTTLYSGNLSGSGSLFLNPEVSATATLAGTQLTKLGGNLSISSGVTLDLRDTAVNLFATDSSLTLNGGSLLFSGQELELKTITLNSGFKVDGGGGKILYDELPVFLDDNNTIKSAYSYVSAGTSNVTFDLLTKGGSLGSVAGGEYRFIAGRVRDKAISAAGGLLTGTVLYLDPQYATTTIQIRDPIIFTGGIVAGGSFNQGAVSVEALVYAPSFSIGSMMTATLTQNGTLLAQTSSSASTLIDNSGTLVLSISSGDKTLANVISGSGKLIKTGAGMATLSGANLYTGATYLNGGSLVLGHATALGSGGPVVFGGGTLRYGVGVTTDVSTRIAPVGAGTIASIDTNINTVTFSGAITGAGRLVKLGEGKLVLAGDVGLLGDYEVQTGTLQVGANGTSGSINANVSVSSGAALSFARSDSISFDKVISGSGRVEQSGAGITTLSANNTFTGGVVLNSGALNVASALAIGGTQASTFGYISFKGGILQIGSSAAALDYSDRVSSAAAEAVKIDTNGYDLTFNNAFGGAGTTLTKYGLGTLKLVANNTYSGLTTVTAGTLELINQQTGTSSILVTGGRLLYTLGNGFTASGAVSLNAGASAVFSISTGSANFGGTVVGAGSVVKQGEGTLTINQSQTNTGGISVTAGTLVFGSNFQSAVSLSSAAGTKLQIGNGSFNIGTVNLDAASSLQLVSNVADATATIFAENILSQGSLVGDVSILAYRPASDGGSSTVSGPLKGKLSTLPDGVTALNLTPNSNGSKVTLAVPNLSLETLSTVDGVYLEVINSLAVSTSVAVTGGTFNLTGATLNAPSANVQFGSLSSVSPSAAKVNISGANAKVIAQTLTIVGSSNVSLAADALTALSGVTTLVVGGTSSSGVATGGSLTLDNGAGTLTVASGQTLKGSGKIVGNLSLSNSDSVLSPGNSPGTIQIAGNLNLNSGTVYLEKSAAAQDMIATTGIVSVGSQATLVLIDYDGSVAAGTAFTSIFSPGATVSAASKFGTIRVARRNALGVNVFSVMYTLDDSAFTSGTVNMVRRPFDSIGVQGNLAGFGRAVDARIRAGAAQNSEAVAELGTGVDTTAAAALQLAAANPAAYAELAALSSQRVLTINQGLVDHFSSLRTGLSDQDDGEYHLWTSGYGSWHKQSGNAAQGTAGFSGNSGGSMFGVEKRRGNLVFGVTGALGSTSASFISQPGNASTDSWHGGAYASAKLGSYVLESAAFFGSTDSSARRSISATGLTSQEGRIKVSGSEWLANVGLARPITAGSFVLTPSARLIAQGQSQNAVKENDMKGLEVALNKQRTSSFLQQLGLEARRNFTVATKPVAASLQLDWIHNYDSQGRVLNMALAGDSNASYGYRSSSAGADSLRVGGALESALGRRTSIRLSVDYQSQSNASTTRGAVSLGYTF